MQAERILVYIAHPTVLEVTAFRIELMGMTANAVRSGKEFSKSLSDSLPDAVILDLDLEVGEGMTWIETLASDECTSHVPIMCISSRGDLTEAEAAYKAGARSFLIAPYDPVVLDSKLRTMLDEAAAAQVAAEDF
ncbi:MAG: response regulator [Planctomycetota bacterium]